jgi:hypothetical protein
MAQSGFKFVAADDRQSIVGPGFRLTFARSGERWTHALAIGDGPAHVLNGIACAIEGDPERDDPRRVVSPAYQEIQPHPNEQGICLLLTGMATPHHFSTVVVARRVKDRLTIAVDLADRCRAPIDILAATYTVQLGSSDLIDASSERIVWGGDALGQGRLEFAADARDSVALSEAGRRATRVQALAAIDPSTYTQRLRYQWTWTPPESPRAVAGPVPERP